MKQLVVALICAVFTLSTVYAQDAKKKKDTVTFFGSRWRSFFIWFTKPFLLYG